MKRSHIITFGVVSACLLFFVPVICIFLYVPKTEAYKNCIHDQSKEGRQQEQKNTPTFSLVCEAHTFDAHNGVITAGATLFIGFFTLVLGVATVYLWDAGERQLAQSRESMQRQLRAYVTVENAKIEPIPASDMDGIARARISVSLKNSGATPTRHMVACTSWKLFDQEIPEGYDFPDIEPEERMLIPPNDSVGGWVFVIPQSDVEKVVKESGYLYVWGWVDYNDVFDGTPRHTTEYYFRVSLKDDAPGSNLLRSSFEPIPHRPIAMDEDAIRRAKPYNQAKKA
jgi:hypothetical protein